MIIKEKRLLINYIFMTLIMILIVSICLYIIKVHNINKKESFNNSILTEFLDEIKLNEIDDYILGSENTFIFVSSSDIKEYRAIEEKIKDDIVDINLREYILYLNIKNIKDEYKEFIKKIPEFVKYSDLDNLPLILVYNFLELKEVKSINSFDDIKELFDKYGVNYLND